MGLDAERTSSRHAEAPRSEQESKPEGARHRDVTLQSSDKPASKDADGNNRPAAKGGASAGEKTDEGTDVAKRGATPAGTSDRPQLGAPLSGAFGGIKEAAGALGEKVGQAAKEAAGAVGEKVGQAAGAAKEAAGAVGEKVGQAAGAVGEKVGQAAGAAKEAAGAAGQKVDAAARAVGETAKKVEASPAGRAGHQAKEAWTDMAKGAWSVTPMGRAAASGERAYETVKRVAEAKSPTDQAAAEAKALAKEQNRAVAGGALREGLYDFVSEKMKGASTGDAAMKAAEEGTKATEVSKVVDKVQRAESEYKAGHYIEAAGAAAGAAREFIGVVRDNTMMASGAAEGGGAGPHSEAPKAEGPKAEAPKAEAPRVEAPKAEAPKAETPTAEAPKAEAPKAEAPTAEAPKTETPTAEAPKAEAPTTEAPKAETSNAGQPPVEIVPDEISPGELERVTVPPEEPVPDTERPPGVEQPPVEVVPDEISPEELQQVTVEAPEPAPDTDRTPGAELGQEILEEFEQAQQRWGQAQEEAPISEQPGAGDLNEPGRIEELDSGYDPNWAPEGRHRFPAENKGTWVEGGPGDGRWQPHDPGAFGLDKGQSIQFRDGVPDLSEYAIPTKSGQPGTLHVEGLTGEPGDYGREVRELTQQEGGKFRDNQQWLSDNDASLHHFGGTEVQIVPERLHGALSHQGSASELRQSGTPAGGTGRTGGAEADNGPRLRVDPTVAAQAEGAQRVRVDAHERPADSQPQLEEQLTDGAAAEDDRPAADQQRRARPGSTGPNGIDRPSLGRRGG